MDDLMHLIGYTIGVIFLILLLAVIYLIYRLTWELMERLRMRHHQLVKVNEGKFKCSCGYKAMSAEQYHAHAYGE